MPIRVLAISLLLFDLVISIIDLSSSLVSCTSKETKAENELYHWGGIAILSVLLAKTLALVLALGRSFFRHPGHVVDGFVVIGALLLEAFLKGKGAGLIVVVSLWRVVKVVESALELSDEAIEAQIEEIVSQFQVLRDENRRLQETISGKDKRIEELEEALERCRDQCRLDRLTPTKV
nr:TPA_asm: hypothetical protein HUJ06_025679 [Nelumbo nucifera]